MTGADAPAANDYVQALQNPRRVFRSATLQAAEFTQDAMGMPLAVRGASAAVFRARVEGVDTALRCFLRLGASSEQRSDLLGGYLARCGVTSIVRPEWLDAEVRVKGTQWPVLRMEWVDGDLLSYHVGRLVTAGDAAGLLDLAGRWLALVQQLETARIGHGDLQHGNVLVDRRSGQLRLIDLDGAWVPPIAPMPPPHELGHPNYAHPGRSPGDWGPAVDSFSALVIYLSLLALAFDPYLSVDSRSGPRGLWSDFHNGENLLFTREDFQRPGQTPVWSRIGYLGQPWVGQLLGVLDRQCRATVPPRVAFSQALRDAAASPPWVPAVAGPPAEPARVVVDNSGTVWGAPGRGRVVVETPAYKWSQPTGAPPATRFRVWLIGSAAAAAASLVTFLANHSTFFLAAAVLLAVGAGVVGFWLLNQRSKAPAAAPVPATAPPHPVHGWAPASGPPPTSGPGYLPPVPGPGWPASAAPSPRPVPPAAPGGGWGAGPG
jgi:hypothetical protein